jgi:hypothetical protein
VRALQNLGRHGEESKVTTSHAQGTQLALALRVIMQRLPHTLLHMYVKKARKVTTGSRGGKRGVKKRKVRNHRETRAQSKHPTTSPSLDVDLVCDNDVAVGVGVVETTGSGSKASTAFKFATFSPPTSSLRRPLVA